MMSIQIVIVASAILLIHVSIVISEEIFSPEEWYKKTAQKWESKHARRSPNSWEVWKEFATTITSKYESIVGKDGSNAVTNTSGPSAVEIIGALEEGILFIERIVFQQSQESNSDDQARDSALAVMYTEYGRLLLYSSETTYASFGSHPCYALAKDPHTLLIGAPERLNEYQTTKKKVSEDDENLLASLFGPLCRDNAENALRNAKNLDATQEEAAVLLAEITGGATRKPKEFVAELFDSFADTFDERLTNTLEYRVPLLIGQKVGEILETKSVKVDIRNVLDAGCGTGLAGRELRKAIDYEDKSSRITLVGVDASSKMLEIARQCTATKGCGLPAPEATPEASSNDPKLYDALIDLDLEEMTLENTLMTAASAQSRRNSSFDLVVAADVFVYFGSLESVLGVLANLQTKGGILVFTCERIAPSEAPEDGFRLLPTGRFAHTKAHTVQAAGAAGYSLVDYSEIVPRTEKGVAVDGHMFVFTYTGDGSNWKGEL